MPKDNKLGGKILKIKKNSIYTILIIIAAIILAGILIYFRSTASASDAAVSLAKCIGQNSKVYVQTGCSHCAEQESLFGSSWKYLNSTDCANKTLSYLCYKNNITRIPTWIINGQEYVGVQSISELKNLTGC